LSTLRPDSLSEAATRHASAADCAAESIPDPARLAHALEAIPGVVGHGAFRRGTREFLREALQAAGFIKLLFGLGRCVAERPLHVGRDQLLPAGDRKRHKSLQAHDNPAIREPGRRQGLGISY